MAKVIEIYLVRMNNSKAREAIHNISANPQRQSGLVCASIFWDNEQFVKCSDCLENIIKKNQGDQIVWKFYIAGTNF